MERQLFWVSLLITAIIGAWRWNQISQVMSGPLPPLLNFAAGLAVAGGAVLVARYAVSSGRGRNGGRN